MRDLRAAKILSHRRNIQRYSRLLATDITELEREYLHKRIAEEQAELERWTTRAMQDQFEEASVANAAQAVPKNQDGESHA
jgi:hypothetical protein